MMHLALSLLIAVSFAKERKPTQEANVTYVIEVKYGDLLNTFKLTDCKVQHLNSGKSKPYNEADCKFVTESLRSLPNSLNETSDCNTAWVEITRPTDKVKTCLRGRSPTAHKVRELVNLMALDF